MRNKKRISIILLICLFVLSLTMFIACNKKQSTDSDNKTLTPQINYTTLEILPQESVSLIISSYDGAVDWSCNAFDIATINNDGLVTGVSIGRALVTAKTDNATFSCEINVVANKTGSQSIVLDCRYLDEANKQISMYTEQVCDYSAYVCEGNKKELIENYTIISNSDCLLVDNEAKALTALKNGTAELTVSGNVNDVVLTTHYSVVVRDNKILTTDKEVITLLTPKGLRDQAVVENTSQKLFIYQYNRINGEKSVIDNSNLEFNVLDSEIISISAQGVVQSKKSGSTTVMCKKDGQEIAILVNVYCPIYTAEDMDILSLFTYKKTAENAEELLSNNYLLMNDIDYSTHVRNYILPIASVTLNSVSSNNYSTTGYSAATLSYYSLAWKDILGLVEKKLTTITKEDYLSLYIDENREFNGINPNGIPFTGIFDGNGYAIKNAWYMYDNLLGCHYTTGWTPTYYSFIGINNGTICNLEFDNLQIPNSATRWIDGKYYEAAAYSSSVNASNNPDAFHNIYLGMKTPCTNTEFTELKESAPRFASVDKSTIRTIRSGRDWDAYAEACAMVIVNSGTINNVSYLQTITTRGSVHSKDKAGYGLVLVNSGTVDSCVVGIIFKKVVIDVVGVANTIASINLYSGKVNNCSTYIVDEQKRDIATIRNFYQNQGTFYGSNKIYRDILSFNLYVNGYDKNIWTFNFGTIYPTLKDNYYGI